MTCLASSASLLCWTSMHALGELLSVKSGRRKMCHAGIADDIAVRPGCWFKLQHS